MFHMEDINDAEYFHFLMMHEFYWTIPQPSDNIPDIYTLQHGFQLFSVVLYSSAVWTRRFVQALVCFCN